MSHAMKTMTKAIISDMSLQWKKKKNRPLNIGSNLGAEELRRGTKEGWGQVWGAVGMENEKG